MSEPLAQSLLRFQIGVQFLFLRAFLLEPLKQTHSGFTFMPHVLSGVTFALEWLNQKAYFHDELAMRVAVANPVQHVLPFVWVVVVDAQRPLQRS
jgi:hypothetical protein